MTRVVLSRVCVDGVELVLSQFCFDGVELVLSQLCLDGPESWWRGWHGVLPGWCSARLAERSARSEGLLADRQDALAEAWLPKRAKITVEQTSAEHIVSAASNVTLLQVMQYIAPAPAASHAAPAPGVEYIAPAELSVARAPVDECMAPVPAGDAAPE